MLQDSERKYLQDLQGFNEVYITPLSKWPGEQLLAALPGRLAPVLQVHSVLLEQLQGAVDKAGDHEGAAIGSIFKTYSPMFKMYNAYVSSHAAVLERVTELEKKKKKFRSLLNDITTSQAAKEKCRGLPFNALLIMPIQRLPRYQMLLESLLKRTPADHPDHDDVQEALKGVLSTTTTVNQSIGVKESMDGVVELSRRLKGASDSILSPSRLFVASRVFKVAPGSAEPAMASATGQQVEVVLMNDCVLVGQVVGERFTKLAFLGQWSFDVYRCMVDPSACTLKVEARHGTDAAAVMVFLEGQSRRGGSADAILRQHSAGQKLGAMAQQEAPQAAQEWKLLAEGVLEDFEVRVRSRQTPRSADDAGAAPAASPTSQGPLRSASPPLINASPPDGSPDIQEVTPVAFSVPSGIGAGHRSLSQTEFDPEGELELDTGQPEGSPTHNILLSSNNTRAMSLHVPSATALARSQPDESPEEGKKKKEEEEDMDVSTITVPAPRVAIKALAPFASDMETSKALIKTAVGFGLEPAVAAAVSGRSIQEVRVLKASGGLMPSGASPSGSDSTIIAHGTVEKKRPGTMLVRVVGVPSFMTLLASVPSPLLLLGPTAGVLAVEVHGARGLAAAVCKSATWRMAGVAQPSNRHHLCLREESHTNERGMHAPAVLALQCDPLSHARRWTELSLGPLNELMCCCLMEKI